MMQTPLTVRRWSRTEYETLVDAGFFHGEPVELLGGQLIVAEPRGTYHVTVVGLVDDALRALLPPGWIVRSQAPLSLDDESAPEPDIAVVPGTRADYLNGHPTAPPFVLEVADTSVGFDRRVKGSVYARAGVQDYWIVNVTERTVEVYRDPQPDPAAAWGWSYRSVQTLRATDTITPLALPATPIALSAFFPRPAG
jgi:Uma2 family endonuclease